MNNFMCTVFVHPLSAFPIPDNEYEDNDDSTHLVNVINNSFNPGDSVLLAKQKAEKALRQFCDAHNHIPNIKYYYYLDQSNIVNFSKPINPDLINPIYNNFLSQLKYVVYNQGTLDIDILVFDICIIFKKYPISFIQI